MGPAELPGGLRNGRPVHQVKTFATAIVDATGQLDGTVVRGPGVGKVALESMHDAHVGGHLHLTHQVAELFIVSCCLPEQSFPLGNFVQVTTSQARDLSQTSPWRRDCPVALEALLGHRQGNLVSPDLQLHRRNNAREGSIWSMVCDGFLGTFQSCLVVATGKK